jgi:hypothetical protein
VRGSFYPLLSAEFLLPSVLGLQVIWVHSQACGGVFPFAISTSICCSSVSICSGLYFLIGIPGAPSERILSHFRWYKNIRSRQSGRLRIAPLGVLPAQKSCRRLAPSSPTCRMARGTSARFLNTTRISGGQSQHQQMQAQQQNARRRNEVARQAIPACSLCVDQRQHQ